MLRSWLENTLKTKQSKLKSSKLYMGRKGAFNHLGIRLTKNVMNHREHDGGMMPQLLRILVGGGMVRHLLSKGQLPQVVNTSLSFNHVIWM
jgi:hypothetical protein